LLWLSPAACKSLKSIPVSQLCRLERPPAQGPQITNGGDGHESGKSDRAESELLSAKLVQWRSRRAATLNKKTAGMASQASGVRIYRGIKMI